MNTFKKLAGLAFYFALDEDYLTDALYEYIEKKYPEEYAKACENEEEHDFVFGKMREEFREFFGFDYSDADCIC